MAPQKPTQEPRELTMSRNSQYACEGVAHRLERLGGERNLETYSLSRTSHGYQHPRRRGVLERRRVGGLRGEEVRR